MVFYFQTLRHRLANLSFGIHFDYLQTYLCDRQVADSAATATAMLAGVKANWFTVGLTSKAQNGDCIVPKDAKIETIIQQSEREGQRLLC